MEGGPPSADAPSSPTDPLRDADEEPRSMQSPSSPPSSSDPAAAAVAVVDPSLLPAQEAADVLFRNAQILAPMVRASTLPLRALALSHGATLTYTEELVDRSILPAERVVNAALGTIDYRVPLSHYSKKVQRRMANDRDNPDQRHGAVLLRIDPKLERNKLIYQIGTGESNFALEAALKVIEDVSGMDVNMGCPKKFSVSGGMGSALLSDVRRACDIISTLRRNLTKPVSAKVRLLDPADPRPTLDFVRSLIKAGANAVAIHGRIVGDEAQAPARWETLAEVVRQLKQTEGVPVIINGDLYTRADIREMRRRTGCDGIMLARPALYNVGLFHRGDDDEGGGAPGENDARNGGEDGVPLSRFQTTHHEGPYGYRSPLLLPRAAIVREYLSHCVRYRAHSKNAKYVVCEMMNARRAPTHRVPFLDMTYEGGQTINDVCKCKSLEDLCRVWDVRGSAVAAGRGVAGTRGEGGAEANVGDGRRYDDRYFLDPDKFRKERRDVVDAAVAASKHMDSKADEEEKKTDDDREAESVPRAKRPKI